LTSTEVAKAEELRVDREAVGAAAMDIAEGFGESFQTVLGLRDGSLGVRNDAPCPEGETPACFRGVSHH